MILAKENEIKDIIKRKEKTRDIKFLCNKKAKTLTLSSVR